MGNGKVVKNPFERILKLQTNINKLVIEKKRDPEKVLLVLQWILSGSGPGTFTMDHQFEEFFDFGVIRVPNDFNPSSALKDFRDAFGSSIQYMAEGINDDDFSDPSYILTPNEELRVRVFRQVSEGLTSYEERMQFLKWQEAVFPGAHGITLVLDKIICDKSLPTLPKDYSFSSYDYKGHLPKWRGQRGLPTVANLHDRLQFAAGDLVQGRGPYSAFFCFTKV